MRIAVVGGGTRCRLLLELVEKHAFEELNPQVVAVADPREDAPGRLKAAGKGIDVTPDYNDFFRRDDIDLIVELTGNQETFFDIILKKNKNVRAINHRTAQLFWELSRVSQVQQRTTQELAKTKSLYQVAINDLIQDDVMVIDLNYRILDVNDALLNKLGLERDEVIGKFCYQITHHQDVPCSGDNHPCPLAKTVGRRQSYKTTHVHLDKNNQEIYYSIVCYPIFTNGQVTGAVEISRDITKEVTIQRVMIQQEKLASIGRLAAGVAHEVNNPLTTILTSAILVQEEKGASDPDHQELQTIIDETMRCRKIVTALLNFARQSKPAKSETEINQLVKACARLGHKQGEFNDVRTELDLAADLPVVFVDKDQVQQAVINLALNAIEATAPGGVVTLATRHLPESEMIEIVVSDTGQGIPEENLPHVFDLFFTTKADGTGLGLAITQGIIEQHGGTIAVKSRPGKGTRFCIRLPASRGEGNE